MHLSLLAGITVRQRWLIVVSLLTSFALVAYTKSPFGELLGEFTDHLHHARITWTFFHFGLETYQRPYGETGTAVFFPHFGITWERYPLAYPPGMMVVFTPMALIGRYVPMETITFGKVTVIYLTVIMHAALAKMIPLVNAVRSRLYGGLFVLMWIFAVRVSLLGFYDGAWLLFGALSIDALVKDRPLRSTVFVVIAALISYRAVSLAPIAFVAFVRMWLGSEPPAKKIAVTTFAVVAGVIVTACFWALLHYSPKGPDAMQGVGSSLMPLSFRPYVVLYTGLGAAAFLTYRTNLLVGACTALCTVFAILHGGHTWHGALCFAPMLALPLSTRRPFVAQLVLAFLVLFLWHMAFDYDIFRFLEEVIRFIEWDGKYNKPAFCI